MAVLKGRPLLNWVKEALEQVCQEVWLSLRAPEQPEARLQDQFHKVCWDPPGKEGPLAGLWAGLKALKKNEILLAATCDQPLLSIPLLQGLKETWEERKGLWALFLVDDKGCLQPFPGVYHPALVPGLERFLASGTGSVRAWLKGLPPSKKFGISPKIWYLWDDGRSLYNINFREDLEKLKKLLKEKDLLSSV